MKQVLQGDTGRCVELSASAMLKLGVEGLSYGTQSLLQQHHLGLCYVGFSMKRDGENEANTEGQLEVNKFYAHDRSKLQGG